MQGGMQTDNRLLVNPVHTTLSMFPTIYGCEHALHSALSPCSLMA